MSRRRIAAAAGWVVGAFVALAAGEAAAQAPSGDAAAEAPPGDAAAAAESAGESEGESEVIARAREHFRKGLELTNAGRLEEALAEFQQAYDLSPTYPILYNIGQVSRHVGDAARSLRAFERYLAEGGEEIEAGRRAEVEAEIAGLRPAVGTVRVEVDAAGAAVLVDGVKVGEAPLREPIYVNPGKHRVEAELGGRRAVKPIEVGGGASMDVVLAIPPIRARQAPPKPRPPVEEGGRPLWIGWAATGALATGAAVTGVLAVVSAAELADARYAGPDRRPGADSEVQALGERVDALAVATDVLAVGAAVGLGVTLALTFSDPGRQGGAKQGRAVSLGGGPGRVWVWGTF